MGSTGDPTPKRTGRLTVGHNITLSWSWSKLLLWPLVREGAPQRQYNNSQTEYLVTSSRMDSTPRHTDWPSVVTWLWLLLCLPQHYIRTLPEDEKPHQNWSRVPDGRLTPRRTGRLIVGRNVTLTLTWKAPCGGRLEYLQSSPTSHKRRWKGNSVNGGITGPPCSCGI
jgi:hypothetical protein